MNQTGGALSIDQEAVMAADPSSGILDLSRPRNETHTLLDGNWPHTHAF
jgi:hypothetical protein